MASNTRLNSHSIHNNQPVNNIHNQLDSFSSSSSSCSSASFFFSLTMVLDLYNISMEKTSGRTENLSFRFLIMIDGFLFQKLTCWVNATYYGFASTSRYWRCFPTTQNPKASFSHKEDDDDEKLSKEEMKTVMENLGLFCSEEEAEDKSLPFGSIDELSKLFVEKEPSMAEVKEAFDVFDANGDGFIDAEELQKVLCVLGLKEGDRIENCKKMIESFDENKDGKIDFEEFAKFMESVV